MFSHNSGRGALAPSATFGLTASCVGRNYSVMKLSDWMKREKVTATQLAERTGRALSTITRAARGESVPDPETMRLIGRETNGEVQPNDFIEIPVTVSETAVSAAG